MTLSKEEIAQIFKAHRQCYPELYWKRTHIVEYLEKRICPACLMAFASDVCPERLGDSIPEIGWEECIGCGTVWDVISKYRVRTAPRE